MGLVRILASHEGVYLLVFLGARQQLMYSGNNNVRACPNDRKDTRGCGIDGSI